MLDWLTVSVQSRPNHPALTFEGNTWTYFELDQQVGSACAWLSSKGVDIGTHVAVLLPNHPHTVVTIHALMRLGAVIVPLNTRLTVEELRYQVGKVNCQLVICADETRVVADELGVITASIDAADPSPPVHIPPRELDFDETLAIVFTSGTTGHPKGAALTYGNFFYSATASAYRLGTMPDDSWLCVLPLYHVGGLSIIMRCALYGTTIALHTRFDITEVNRALDNDAITLISLVPTMLFRLLAERTNAPPHLRLVLLGGAAADHDLVTRTQALRIPVATTYGLSEACSQVATQTPEGTIRKPGSVGRPVPFSSVRIVDETGRVVANSEYGEVTVAGPTVMRGYFGDADATTDTLKAGRLHTGDIGYLDDDGELWLVQRRSDLIVTGGENVYPVEVESVLRSHASVADACVVGLPDPEWGQRVAAAIIPKPGQMIEPDAVIAHARDHLAGYKVPRTIRFVEQFPLTASGKIERKSIAGLFDEDNS